MVSSKMRRVRVFALNAPVDIAARCRAAGIIACLVPKIQYRVALDRGNASLAHRARIHLGKQLVAKNVLQENMGKIPQLKAHHMYAIFVLKAHTVHNTWKEGRNVYCAQAVGLFRSMARQHVPSAFLEVPRPCMERAFAMTVRLTFIPTFPMVYLVEP